MREYFRATIEPAEDGTVIVTPRDRVGTAYIDGLHVSVAPKVPVRSLLQIMADAADPYRWLNLDAATHAGADIVDSVAALFARSCLRTFERGLYRSYRRTRQHLPFVRGRVDVSSYIRTPAPLPVPVDTDVFDEDNAENQVLAAALQHLRVGDLSTHTRDAVERAWRAVRHVSRVPDPVRLASEITWDRRNLYYRQAVRLARIVLSDGTVRPGDPYESVPGFVIDTPRVIEEWARVQLRRAWGLTERDMPTNWSGKLWLDHGRTVELIPDLGVCAAGDWSFVGDVKYKVLDDRQARRDDVYQMLAYLTATGLKQGTLIYVGTAADDQTIRITTIGSRINVVSIDLSRPDPTSQLVHKLG